MAPYSSSGLPAFAGNAVAAIAADGSQSNIWAALSGPADRTLRRATHRRAAAEYNRMQWYAIGLALALAVALLLAFQAVVRQSVQQGDARREAVALQTETWSACNLLHGRAARDDCRSRADLADMATARSLCADEQTLLPCTARLAPALRPRPLLSARPT